MRKRQSNTGSAGALARYEREERNSYSIKKFELERAAHAPAGEGARAPSTNGLVPDRINLFCKAHKKRIAVFVCAFCSSSWLVLSPSIRVHLPLIPFISLDP